MSGCVTCSKKCETLCCMCGAFKCLACYTSMIQNTMGLARYRDYKVHEEEILCKECVECDLYATLDSRDCYGKCMETHYYWRGS